MWAVGRPQARAWQSRRGGRQGEEPGCGCCERILPGHGCGLLGLRGLRNGRRRGRGQSRYGRRREERPGCGCSLRVSEGLESRKHGLIDGCRRSWGGRGHGLLKRGGGCMMGLGVSRSGATIGTKSPCAPPARADSIKPRVDAVGAKANGKDKADKRAATGAPTKVVPGAGKELLQSEQ